MSDERPHDRLRDPLNDPSQDPPHESLQNPPRDTPADPPPVPDPVPAGAEDAEDDGFRRLHPVAAVANSLSLIRSNVLTIVLVAFLGGGRESRVSLYMLAASFALVLLVGIGRWVRFRYRAEPGRLVVLDGLLVRRELTLPRERIQVMEQVEGFVERLFRLVNVRIQTGSQREAVTLRALTREEAQRVMDVVRSPRGAKASAQGAGAGGGGELEERQEGGSLEEGPVDVGAGAGEVEPGRRGTRPIDRFHPSVEIALSRKRLVQAAATSGGFGVTMSILGTIYTQAEAVMGGSALVDWLAERLPGLEMSSWTVLFAVFLVVSWVLSFTGFLLSNAGFVIRADAQEAVVSRGLLERRRTTLPFGRIQALRYVQGLLRQPFGLGSLHTESIGARDDQGMGSTLVFPMLPKRALPEWPAELFERFGFVDPPSSLPRKALKRYLLRSCLPVLLLGTLAFGVRFDGELFRIPAERVLLLPHLAEPLGALQEPETARAVIRWLAGIGLAAAAAGVWAWSRWRTAGWLVAGPGREERPAGLESLAPEERPGTDEMPAPGIRPPDERLILRQRRLALETVVVPANRIQDVTLSRTPLQRRSGLCTLTVRYASGVTGRSNVLRDLDLAEGRAVADWFRERQAGGKWPAPLR